MPRDANESIEVKSAVEATRSFPNIKLGSKGLEGVKHGVVEIIGNSKDEASSGYGDTYDLELHADGSISVRDYGRGIPLGWNEKHDGWNWDLIFCTEWSGGKYFDTQKILREVQDWSTFDPSDHDYLLTVGQHGTGASAVQMTSEWFEVTSIKEGVASRMRYEKGYPVLEELEVKETDQPDGTLIHWKPDDEVFTDTDVPEAWLSDIAEIDAYVTGMNVNFTSPSGTTRFEASNIFNLLAENISENQVGAYEDLKHPTDSSGDIIVIPVEMAISGGSYRRYFHNQVEVMGGSMINAFHTAVAKFFRERAKESGLRFSPSDWEGLVATVIKSASNKTNYEGQTKYSFSDQEIYNTIYDLAKYALDVEWSRQNPWIVVAVEKAIKNAERRAQVMDIEETLKEVNKVSRSKEIITDFASCSAYEQKRYEDVELFIVEGKSALGSLKDGRDGQFQAVLPIRGKSLNVYKAPIIKMLANREIKNLVNILGSGVDLSHAGVETFDIDNLRVGKVIFLTDADVDGYHIRVLLTAIFWKLFPELLERGMIYVAETPLYHVLTNSGDEYYCTDEKDFEDLAKSLGGRSVFKRVDRLKGLGQVNGDVLWDTTLNPHTRNLVPLKVDPEDPELLSAFEVIWGDNTDVRKRKILSDLLGFPIDSEFEEMTSLSKGIASSGMGTGVEYETVLLEEN